MNVAEIILVIFLSAALLVLLILAIAAAVLVIGVLRDIKKIADRAETASESIGEFMRVVGKQFIPMLLSSTVAMAAKRLKKKCKKKEDD